MHSQVRILPAESILPFEWSDGLNHRTSELQSDDAVVHHPFAVVSSNDSFVLLEETARFQTLCQAGIAHFPVQVCSGESVGLVGERLALIGFGADDLGRLIAAHSDQLCVNPDREPSGSEWMKAAIQFSNQPESRLWLRHSTHTGCPAALSILFRGIRGKGAYIRIIDPSAHPDTPFKVMAPSGWISLPSFGLDDVMAAAVSERLFPPDAIRINCAYRVLNIDFPMSVLRSDIPLEQKQAFLRDLMLFREQTCRTSLIEGRVYILNR
ncbi:MAG: hypothetical protein KKA42_10535 [candidate division Zixibacteria bacterium]|nr:hypothetical protein [candidate division Zixibacteria bacterium]